MPQQHIDTVIHAAGKAHSDAKTNVAIKSFYDVNFEGTKNLCYSLEALKKLPTSFVFISTVSVYGLNGGQMIDENADLNGLTPYAKSKILAEAWLTEWAKKHKVILTILRLPLVAGANPPGNLGSMINSIKTGRYLSIGDGGARKSMVWAEDVAKIIPLLAVTGGIFNLTDEHHPSFKELELAISKGFGKKPPIAVPKPLAIILGKLGDILGSRFPVNSNMIAKITTTLTFDDRKAKTILGWKPSSVLEKLSEVL